MDTIQKRYIQIRDLIKGACLIGYIHLQIAVNTNNVVICKPLVKKLAPNYWTLSYFANLYCTESIISKLYERQSKDNITIHKLLNYVEQNYKKIFDRIKWSSINQEIRKDRLDIANKNMTLTKLRTLRDKYLFHFDKANLRANYFQSYYVGVSEIEELYLLVERILNKYAMFIENKKSYLELSGYRDKVKIELSKMSDTVMKKD